VERFIFIVLQDNIITNPTIFGKILRFFFYEVTCVGAVQLLETKSFYAHHE
jgi:hypothetical protein